MLEITAEGTAGPVKVVLDLVVILPLMLSGLLVPSVLEWEKIVLNLVYLIKISLIDFDFERIGSLKQILYLPPSQVLNSK